MTTSTPPSDPLEPPPEPPRATDPLSLWARGALHPGAPPGDAAVWQQVAALPLALRRGFADLARRACDATNDNALRAACLRVLKGASGRDALGAAKDALDSDDEDVRAAALDVFAAAIDDNDAAAVHALSHPNPEVRRAALPRVRGGSGDLLRALAWVDDETRPQVEAVWATEPLTGPMATGLLVLGRAGLLPRARVRALLDRLPLRAAAFPNQHARPIANSASVVVTDLDRALTSHRDDLDEVFSIALFTDDGALRADGLWQTALQAVNARALSSYEAVRVAAALLTCHVQAGAAHDAVGGLAAALAPAALLSTTLSPAQRRAAARASLAHPPPTARFESGDKQKPADALQAQAVAHADGAGLEAVAAFAVARMFRGGAYATTVALFGADAWADAYVAARDDDARAAVFGHSPEHDADRLACRQLVEAVRVRLVDDEALYAALAGAAGGDARPIFAGLNHVHPTLPRRVLERILAPSASWPSAEHSRGDDALWSRLGRAAALLVASCSDDEVAALARGLDADACERGAVRAALPALCGRDSFRAAAVEHDVTTLRALLAAVEESAPAAERPFSLRLVRHTDPVVRAWAKARALEAPPPPTAFAGRLARVDAAALGGVLDDVFTTPQSGVAAALLSRTPPPLASPQVCAALLCAHDSIDVVASTWPLYADESDAFFRAVAALVRARAGDRDHLPLIARAVLCDDDKHLLALQHAAAAGPGVHGLFSLALSLPAPRLAVVLAQAVAAVVTHWRFRRPALFAVRCTGRLSHALVPALVDLRGRGFDAAACRALESIATSMALLLAEAAAPETQDELKALLIQHQAALPTLHRARLLSAVGVDASVPPPERAALRAALEGSPDGRIDDDSALQLLLRATPAWLDDQAHKDAALQPLLERFVQTHKALWRPLLRSPHALVAKLAATALNDPAHGTDLESWRLVVDGGYPCANHEGLADARVRAAEHLVGAGDLRGVAFLWSKLDDADSDGDADLEVFLNAVGPARAWALFGAVVVAGHGVVGEDSLVGVVRSLPLPLRADAAARAAANIEDSESLQKLTPWLRGRAWFDPKVAAFADVCAWGQRQARGLLGRATGIEMTMSGLGHTRLAEPVVYVSPLPILRGDAHGDDVVAGLVLHEVGHHMFHAGVDNAAVWKRAQDRGLHGLLNLVADEHLERNVRALSPAYDRRLKRLCAYAFQRMTREIGVGFLLHLLGVHAAPVLCASTLTVARATGMVGVTGGQMLRLLEERGSSFSRFMRALRMGLGQRQPDARVERALSLFDREFRGATMERLFDIAVELKAIFGDETNVLDAFELHASLDGSDDDATAEGFDPDDLRRAVDEATRGKRPPTPGVPGNQTRNTGGDTAFSPLTKVVPLVHVAASQRALAVQVLGPTRRLRDALRLMGMGTTTERRRTSGRSLDRQALLRAVVAGDPRALMRRVPVRKDDLFLGVAVDCSGSMASRESMQKAKLFSALLAEACRGLDNVELRLIGFTDSTLYDAGDARRPAAHAFVAGGGNNDAGALDYVAALARRSKRTRRVLVMISDGSPTECTVTSLKALVVKLVREGMTCAQVAVQPIADRCFPEHVEIVGSDVKDAARRFAVLVERWATRSL